MKFHDTPLVKAAFSTLRPATTGIILVAGIQVFIVALMNVPFPHGSLATLEGWKNLFVWPSVAFYIGALIVLMKTKIHPVFVMLLGAVFGIICL